MIADTLYIALGYQFDRKSAQKTVERAEKVADEAQKTVKKKGLSTGRVLTGIFTALAPAAMVTGFTALVTEVTASVDALGKAARAAGITAEAMQELEFAAVSSGVPINDLRNALPKLGRRISEAAKGTGEAKKAFDDLGLSAKDLLEVSPDQQFEAIAQALSEVDTNADRMRLSMKLLEEVGPRFATMFAEGSAGLQRMREQARSLGLIMSDDTVQNFEDMENSLGMVRAIVVGLARSLVVELMPSLRELIAAFIDVEDGPAPELRDGIKGIADLIRPMIKFTTHLVKQLTRLSKAMGGAGAVTRALGVALAVVVGAKGLKGALMLTRAMTKANLRLAATTAVAYAPFILFTAFVAGLLLALDDLRGWVEGEDSVLGDIFGDFDESVWEDIQTGLLGIGAALALILTLLTGIPGLIALFAVGIAAIAVYWDDIGAAAADAVTWMAQKFDELIDGLSDKFLEIGAFLGDVFDEAVDGLESTFLEFAGWLEGLWTSTIEWMSGKLDTLLAPLDAVSEKVGGVAGSIAARLGFGTQPEARRVSAGAMARSGGTRINQRADTRIQVDARGMTREDATAAVKEAVETSPVWGNARDAYADAED